MAGIKKQQGKVLSFGELLLRITPDAGGDWLLQNSLPFYIGGAELNMASALALWGVPVRYLTALPDNMMSAKIKQFIENKGVELAVMYNEHRLGLYFLTKGRDLKNDALIYDRAGSAFANLKPGDINWDKAFEGINWFHFSAICPAINQDIANLCLEAVQAASAKGITVSIDLNYRSKLWQYGKTPLNVMPDIVNHCDLVMGNIWAAETMLGIKVTEGVTQSGHKSLYLKEAQTSSESVMAQFPKCKAVANTFRFDAKKVIDYYTTLYTDDEFFVSKEYNAKHIVDKVGSGDCFMAGLIYGYYHNNKPQEIIEFATAAAFEQLYIISDATVKTVEEIYARYEK